MRVKPLTSKSSREPYLAGFLRKRDRHDTLPELQQAIDVEKASRDQMHSLEVELRYTKENLQATIEELETSNEELQATNEELVASNEELQSTNEELHSVNEELYTVNAEHQRKIAQLTQLTDDMDNLLAEHRRRYDLPRSGTLHSQIHAPRHRRISHPASGHRPSHRQFRQQYRLHRLVDDVERVLNKSRSGTTRSEPTRHWYLLRILPYRIGAEQIDGVVITFVGIDALKTTEQELR